MAEDCSQFEGVENCFGWSLCVEIEPTDQPDFPEEYPFADEELIVWLEYLSESGQQTIITDDGSVYSQDTKTITIQSVECRSVRNQFDWITQGLTIIAEEKNVRYAPAREEVDEIDSESTKQIIINVDYGVFFERKGTSQDTFYTQLRSNDNYYYPNDSPRSEQLIYGGKIYSFGRGNFRGFIGTRAAIDNLVKGNTYTVRHSTNVQTDARFQLNESSEVERTRSVFETPRLLRLLETTKKTYTVQTFEYKLCPGHREDTGLPDTNIGEAEGHTIQLCANTEDKDLVWTIVSCNTIGAYFKDESPDQIRISYKLFDRCHYQRIKTFRSIYQERPCSQITFRRKIKTYELAVVRIVFERIRKLTPTPVSIEIKQVRETYHVFPGRTIQYSNSNAIDTRTILFDRLLGKSIQLFDTQGRALIANSNVNGFIEGSQGKADIFGNWLMNIPFPLTRTTVNWRNFSHSDQWEAPPNADIFYYLPNYQPIVNYPDHEIIPTITGGPTEINPTDLWLEISTEDFKVVDVDGHVTGVKLGNWVDVPGSFDQQERTVQFTNKYGGIVHSDYLKRGSLDRIYYSVDEYEYDNGYCRIFIEEEEECMANSDELKSLLLEIKQQVTKNEERLEAIEGILESVSFPATLWEVPSTGLGDPELGTVNNYTPSSPGLQNTFNQLALVMQGLGSTTAHNKTVVSDVGMAIGVDQWRKEYLKPEPAIVPKTFIKRDGKEPDPIQINNLTDLIEWYLKQFDALIGEFSILLEIEQPDSGDPASGSSKPEKLEFFNISETLAEMLGANLNASVNSDLIVNLLSRSLIESGQVKKLAIANSYYLQAIADYLGFEQKHIKKEVPFSFTPKAKSLAELVKEKKIPVDLVKFSGKDNLQVVLLNLLQGAAVSRSGSWRTLRNIADAASVAVQIKDIIKSHQGNAKSIGEDGSIDDFKDFARDVESGFINDEGINKSVYGEKDDSPKIRVIPPKDKEEQNQ